MTIQRCAARLATERAIDALRVGKPILVVTGSGADCTAEVMMAAVHATPPRAAWLVRYTSGFLCAALPGHLADRLSLPAMAPNASGDHPPEYAVAVDAARGIGTGISAADRARTARVLAAVDAQPEDLVRPGHLLPIRTPHLGVLASPYPATAAVDLCVMAGLSPVGLLAALLGADGDLVRGSAVHAFAVEHAIPMVHIDQVIHQRLYHGDGQRDRVRRTGTGITSTASPSLQAIEFEDQLTMAQHTAYLSHTPDGLMPPWVFILTACPHRNPLTPGRCPCAGIFDTCRATIATEGGAIIYLRPVPASPNVTVPLTELTRGSAHAILHDLGLTTVTTAQSTNAPALDETCDIAVSTSDARPPAPATGPFSLTV